MADVIPWGEWRPDVSPYKGSHSPTITNAVPRGDGYGPVSGFSGLSDALATACRGFYAAYDDDATISIFAGTAAAELYKMSNTNYSWDTVSAATYTALSSNAHWQFTQFGTTVIAVQGNDDPQSYVMGSSTDFADLGGNPPNSNYVTTIGQFVVLSGITADPFTIQWSSIADPTEWTAGTNQGDTQTFQDGGMVRGVAGGEFGLVFQDNAIRRMTFSPGSAFVFEFDLLSRELGLLAPYSLVQTRDMIFFLSPVGFQMWHPATGFKPIGKERVDRTFFADCDMNQKHMILGAADPLSTRIVWAYKSSSSGTNGQFDRMMVYDWALDRWSGFVNITGEYMTKMATPGVTLEGLDAISASIDALSVSLDDFPTGFGAKLATADTSHVIGLLDGPALECTLETPDVDMGSRVFVRAARPITDAATVYGSVASRARLADAPSFGTENTVNATGFIPHRVDTRVGRFRNRIPAATAWSFSVGVEPDLVKTGMR
jgi:hypothetical protein